MKQSTEILIVLVVAALVITLISFLILVTPVEPTQPNLEKETEKIHDTIKDSSDTGLIDRWRRLFGPGGNDP